jgi:ABC-type spermidine/putrescine transport system permease subunit II
MSRLLLIPVSIAAVLIYAPLIVVAVFSFDSSSAGVMPIESFTTDWYSSLFDDGDVKTAVANTLKIGLAAVAVSVVLATAGALAVRGRRFRGRGLYEFLIGMPFLLPEIITGLALLTFFQQVGVRLSLGTILIGHVVFALGAAFRVIAARVEALPPSLEEAARDLGRGPLGAFWFVTLPALRSALVTAALIVFALSFDQTVITIFVTSTDNTLPTLLWAKMRLGFTPDLNALATVILGATMLVAIPAALIFGKRQTATQVR